MTYKQFVEKMSKDDNNEYNLKDSNVKLMELLGGDVKNPSFFENISKFNKLELLQG
jgi:hypothetical protein